MAWVNVVELIYPVDAVYTTTNVDASPADLFGGSWNRIGSVTTISYTVPNTDPAQTAPATTAYMWQRTS